MDIGSRRQDGQQPARKRVRLSHLVHFVGNRSPSISDTITIDGVAVDLTGSSVKFQMRQVGSSTLKTDSAATIVSPAAGTVRYDPAALDVNTAGDFVAWWRVTLPGGNTQDTPEFLIEIRDHAPVSNEYVAVEEVKESLSLAGQAFADLDIQRAIAAASRSIDAATGRRFYPDPSDTTRKYVPMNPSYVAIDDLGSFTSMTDSGGASWTLNTDFQLEPLNAVAEGEAYTGIRAINRPFLWDASSMDVGVPGPDARISVTGKFGWAAPPPEIVQATQILATRLMLRSRQAALGVLSFGVDGGMMIARSDPDVNSLIQPYVRTVAW